MHTYTLSKKVHIVLKVNLYVSDYKGLFGNGLLNRIRDVAYSDSHNHTYICVPVKP